MRFVSYDSKRNEKCETEISNSSLNDVHQFIQTWVPDHIMRLLQNPNDYSYSLFHWDKIIKQSLLVGSPWSCFSAITNKRLDGLICLSFKEDKLKIGYIATAPWNYYKNGKMRNIGGGLICYTIRYSIYLKCEGEFLLDALPDAEKYYEGIGMKKTGNVNDAQLKEYKMSESKAGYFMKRFDKNLIQK